MDIIDLKKVKNTRILIIGAGAIGSTASVTLAKMGFKDITVIDNDIVESHNLPNQFFAVNQVNKSKVEALKQIVKQLTEVDIKPIKKEVKDKSDLMDHLNQSIVISAVDNMKTRKIIFEVCKFNFSCHGFIDCRVTYPYLLLYKVDALDINDIHKYWKTLYSDKESLNGRCTAQSTFYTSFQSAVLIALAVQSIIMENDFPFSLKLCFSPFKIIND